MEFPKKKKMSRLVVNSVRYPEEKIEPLVLAIRKPIIVYSKGSVADVV